MDLAQSLKPIFVWFNLRDWTETATDIRNNRRERILAVVTSRCNYWNYFHTDLYTIPVSNFWRCFSLSAEQILFGVDHHRIESCHSFQGSFFFKKKSVFVIEMVVMKAKWKQHYLLVCDLVDDINHLIGWPLIFFIAYAFVTFICYSSSIKYAGMNPEDVPSAMYCDVGYLIVQNLVCMLKKLLINWNSWSFMSTWFKRRCIILFWPRGLKEIVSSIRIIWISW